MIARIILAVLTVIYPFAVFFGQNWLSPRWLALLPLILITARRCSGRKDIHFPILLATALLLAILTWIGNSILPLKFYPVLVSWGMLALFGFSLRHPPSLVERIARITDPNLPLAAIAYTRHVTQVWCVFFLGNGLIALATALWGSDQAWTLYNGFIAYILMGILFAGEWLLRRHLQARWRHG